MEKPAAAPDAVLPGYIYLHPEEAAFVEALVDHMVPADEHAPKGTDLGLNIYIDRARAGAWGKGDRMYQQGPLLHHLRRHHVTKKSRKYHACIMYSGLAESTVAWRVKLADERCQPRLS